MGYLLPILGLSFIASMLLAFYFFDRVVKIQYGRFRVRWEKAGAPHGFFWVPKESASKIKVLPKGASTRARTRHFFLWLLQSPEWIKEDHAASSNIVKVRIFFVLSLACLVSFVVFYVSR